MIGLLLQRRATEHFPRGDGNRREYLQREPEHNDHAEELQEQTHNQSEKETIWRGKVDVLGPSAFGD